MEGMIELPLAWCVTAFRLVGAVGVGFGLFTALLPERSIALYQWIMERFNWRTEPIHPARELRNTRWLGALLVLLGATLFVRLR